MPFKQAFGTAARPVVGVSAAAIAVAIGYFVYTGGKDAADIVPPDASSVNTSAETVAEPVMDAPPDLKPVATAPEQTTQTVAQTPTVSTPVPVQDTADMPLANAVEKPMDAPSQTAPSNQVAQTENTPAIQPADDPSPQAVPVIAAPSIDIVRIPPEGISTIAGRADAGSDIVIFVDGVEVARAKTSGSGEFVALFEVAPEEQPRELQVAAQVGDAQVFSAGSIVIAPFVDPSEPAPLVVAQAAPQVVAQVETTQTSDELNTLSEATTADVAPQSENSTPVPKPSGTDTPVLVQDVAPKVAPTVMQADSTGVKILQSATPIEGVSIDAITYDPQGAVYASGRGRSGATVRLYLDNTALVDAPIGTDGQWRVQLDVPTGLYTLRADMIDGAGKVLNRIEIPFKREDIAVLADLAAGQVDQTPTDQPEEKPQQIDPTQVTPEAVDASSDSAVSQAPTPENIPQARIASVTVQPGNTLWGIASDTYGQGHLYARVFDANAAQIQDPDLIYPGQVFVLPKD